MAFVNTLHSLRNIINSNIDLSNYATKTELSSKANTADLATIATSASYTDSTNKPTIPDTSNFVTNTTLDTKLAKSLEKGITVTATNNTFTIDPNAGALFIVTVSSNSTITISNLDSDFSTNTGSVFSILLTLNADSYTISWPNNISWHGGSAPELSYKNLITFTKFNNSSNWVGGSVVIDDTFPS